MDEDALAWLAAPVLQVAPRLVGAHLSTGFGAERVTVRLTEVEAYAGAQDPGSHAFRGPTPRTRVMFGPAGFLYVYFTYGMHWCANVVTGVEGTASAVLLRAGEVVEGLGLARERRPACRRDVDLARGPARLASCLGLTGEDSGRAIDGRDVVLRQGSAGIELSSGPRVGVAGPGGDAESYPWRFWATGDPTVSTYRAAKPRSAKLRGRA